MAVNNLEYVITVDTTKLSWWRRVKLRFRVWRVLRRLRRERDASKRKQKVLAKREHKSFTRPKR